MEGRGLCYVSTFSCRSGLFCVRPGHAWPRLSLILMDLLQELACSLTQKERGGPWAILCTGATLKDGRRRSRGETDLLVRKRQRGSQWPLSRSDKSHRQREGCYWIQGKYKNSSVYASQWVIYFLLIIIFNLTSCPVGPVEPLWGIMGHTFKTENNREHGHNCDDGWQC